MKYIHDIVHSLEDNQSLENLYLSENHHSQYFSESERQIDNGSSCFFYDVNF